MKNYKAYCFDLDGTVYRGKHAVPSAVTFIHKLQQEGIEPFYVTNNSSKTREQLQASLLAIGIQAPLTHIYSSAYATAQYIKQHFLNAQVRIVGSDGIMTALENEGIEVVPIENEHVDVLVMGMDRQINFDKIAAACRIVQHGATLIGTNEDIKFPSEEYFYPGNGSFVRLVGNVCGVNPIYIGKPSPAILKIVQNEHNFTTNEMVMIGDNYDTDILCGIHFGCDTIHVNTGVTPTKEVENKPQLPTFTVENLAYFK